MKQQLDRILVTAPNKTGECFIRELIQKGLSFAAIANNGNEKRRLEELGVKTIVTVDTNDEGTWIAPDFPVGQVYIFESSLNLSCRYIRILKTWTSEPIYVVIHSGHPRLIYKALGAGYVIYAKNEDVSFLIQPLLK